MSRGARGWPYAVFAAALAVHLLLVGSLPAGGFDRLFNDCTHRGEPGSDFYVVWKAGRNVWRGESPYRIEPKEEPRSWGDYRYLPLSALTVSAAAALLPAREARLGWLVLNELLLAAAVAATLRLAPDRRTGLIAASLWLAFTPFYVELFIGQLDFLLAVGFLGAAAAFLGRAPRAGPAAWIGATTLKWGGAALLPLFLSHRRWKAPALWAVTSLGTAVVWFAARPADWDRFRSTLLRGGFATPHAGNYGLQALVSSTMSFVSPGVFNDLSRWADHSSLVLSYVLIERGLLLAAGAAALAATFLAPRRLTVGEGIALWSSVLAVAWNEFWEHQYVLLLPGLVLLALEGRRRLAVGVWAPLAAPTLFALVDRPHEQIVAAMPAGYDNPDLFILLSPIENFALHTTKAIPAAVLFAAVASAPWRRAISASGRTGPASGFPGEIPGASGR